MKNDCRSHPLHQSCLYRLGNRQKLAGHLKITSGKLRYLSKQHDKLYSEFDVEKRCGGKRRVENPRRELKLVQARLARLISRIAPPDYLFCPVKRRCYVSNAAQHRNQRVIRCLDIRKYYPSTPSSRVFWFFHRVMNCTSDIAGVLTSLATYKQHLPTGSPLSPILAYFSFYDLWENVAAICRDHCYKLTIYIDDVTISGSRLDAAVMWQIKRAIHGKGLTYHKEKHFVGRPAEITGVIVYNDELKAPHRQLKKLHAARQSLAEVNDAIASKKLEGKISGLLGQAAQIQKLRT